MDIDFEFMKEGMAADLAKLLVDKLNMTIGAALDALYDSRTYSFLCKKNTGLYFQSPLYVFSFLEEEIRTGKFNPEEL